MVVFNKQLRFLILIFGILMRPSSSQVVKSTKFQRSGTEKNVFDLSVIQSKANFISNSECGGLCRITPKCVAFYWDKLSGTCNLSSAVAIPELKSTNVLVDVGYDPSSLCTTPHYNKSNGYEACGVALTGTYTYDPAGIACNKIGGRLPEPFDNDDYLKLKSLIAPKYHHWFSGSDVVTEGQYLSQFSGKVLPYIYWRPDNFYGGTGENCMSILSPYGYEDAPCSYSLDVLCEIMLTKL